MMIYSSLLLDHFDVLDVSITETHKQSVSDLFPRVFQAIEVTW